jgi:hypothetical protein
MTTKTKSRNGANRAASNTTDARNSIASRIKALIVNLALWGVIPFGLSVWLIRRLHLEAA